MKFPNFMQNLNIRSKLVGFASFAIILLLVLNGLILYNFSTMQKANTFKESVFSISKNIQDMRIAEKIYLQHYLLDYISDYNDLSKKNSKALKTLTENSIDDDLPELIKAVETYSKQYKNTFNSMVVSHNDGDVIKHELKKPLSDFTEKVTGVIGILEEKEAELMTEGDSLAGEEVEMMNVARDCKIVGLTLQVVQEKYLATGSEEHLKQFNLIMKTDLKDALVALDEFAKVLKDKKILDNAGKAIKSLSAFADIAKKSQENSETQRLRIKNLDTAGKKVVEKVQELFKETDKTVRHSMDSTVTTILVIAVCGIVIFILASFSLIRSILKPVKNITDMVADLAEGEGDLTKRIEVSGDELGTLAGYVNTFIEKIQVTITEIVSETVELSGSSDTLLDVAREMAGGTNMVSEKSSSVAVAADEMNSNMNMVSSAMSDASANANVIATAAEDMKTTIGAITVNTEKASSITSNAVEQANTAVAKVDELKIAADAIGNVTDSINAISRQTNLLALNATIEAARAGEAGKGFAVVASEIKELANQTSEATDEIRTRIEGIQKTTTETTTEISHVTDVIKDVNEIVLTIASAVNEQSETTIEIAGNVAQTSDGIATVNENVSQSSEFSQKINEDISEIDRLTSGVSESGDKINKSANDLSSIARKLGDLVGTFKIS